MTTVPPLDALAAQIKQIHSLVASLQGEACLQGDARVLATVTQLHGALCLASEHLVGIASQARQQERRIDELSSVVLTLNARNL